MLKSFSETSNASGRLGISTSWTAVYPPVYFVIGALNSGGSPDQDKLIIGTEMYSRGPQTPTENLNHWLQAVLTDAGQVPAIVLHELVHFQQAAIRDILQVRDFATFLKQSGYGASGAPDVP